jgi:hypothetical protein
MAEKAGLEWKIRGYPYLVSHDMWDIQQIQEAIEWCADNCNPNSYVWIGHGKTVFVDEKTATFFQLTWC